MFKNPENRLREPKDVPKTSKMLPFGHPLGLLGTTIVFFSPFGAQPEIQLNVFLQGPGTPKMPPFWDEVGLTFGPLLGTFFE